MYSNNNYLLQDGTQGLTRPAVNELGIQAGSSERIRVTSVGNVGIGTTVPGARLHIEDVGAAGSLGITVGGVYYLLTRDSSAGLELHAGWPLSWGSSTANTTPDTGLGRFSAGKVSVDTSARGNALGTLIAANIGIGTDMTSAAAKLSVIGGNVGICTISPVTFSS